MSDVGENVHEEEESVDFIEKDLQPYYVALGRVVYTCGQLQMSLGYLFTALLDGRGKSIFNAPNSDRAQIDMLEAAVRDIVNRELLDDEAIDHAQEQLLKLCRASANLLNARNQLVHSPYTLSVDFDKYKISLVAAHRSGNRFALQLKDVDVLEKMANYEARATSLLQYAMKVTQYFGPFHRLEESLPIPDFPEG